MDRRPSVRTLFASAGLCAVLGLAGCGGGEDGSGGAVPLEESAGYESYQRARTRAAEGRHDLATVEYRRAIAADPDQREFYLQLGFSLFEVKSVAKARGVLEEAKRRFPDDRTVALHLGIVYMRQTQHELAAAELERAAALNPEDPEAPFWLGRALYDRSILFLGTTSIDQAKLDRAIGSFRRAIALAPDRAEYHFRLALALERKRDTAGALASFEAAVAADPNHALAQRWRGSLYVREGDLEKGREALGRALAIDGNDAESHYEMGLLFEQEKNQEAALAAFDNAIARRPWLTEAHFRRSNVLRRLGRDAEADAALQAFEAWTELEQKLNSQRLAAMAQPDDPAKHYELGETLRAAMRFEEAENAYRRAMDLAPDNPMPLYRLAVIHLETGRPALAKTELERVDELAPGDPAVLYKLAKASLAQRDLAAAREVLEEVIALAPDFVDAYVDLALIQVGPPPLQDLAAARANFEKALELDPKNLRAVFNLGSVLYSQGDREGAIARYEEALAIDPGYAKAKELLARVRSEEEGG